MLSSSTEHIQYNLLLYFDVFKSHRVVLLSMSVILRNWVYGLEFSFLQDVSQGFSQGPLTQGMSMSQAFQMSQGMSGLSQAELSQVGQK